MSRSTVRKFSNGIELSDGSINGSGIGSSQVLHSSVPRRRKPSLPTTIVIPVDPEAQDKEVVQLGPPKEMMLHLGDLPPAKRTPAVARLIVSACTLLLVAALMGLFVAVGNTRVDPLFVNTSSGPILGKVRGDADTWLGIPYGTALERFAQSQSVSTWSKQLNALRIGPPCMQAAGAFGYDIPGLESKHFPAPTEKNCLTLSVYAPRGLAEQARKDGAGARRVPVLIFLHGGAFVAGSGSQPLYNASLLASEQGAVVVVPSYRLGPFGFFSHPELSAERETGTSGNQGIGDQSRALRWVRRNIFVFGGDPERITVWGQGAGAVSALLHVAAPRSSGKFRSVAAWSGAIDTSAPPSAAQGGAARSGTGQLPSLAQAEADGVAFATAAGCPAGKGQLACLRGLDANVLAQAAVQGPWAASWGPIRDGTVLPVDVGAVYRSRQALRDSLPGGLLLGHSMNDKRTTLRYRMAYQAAGHSALDQGVTSGGAGVVDAPPQPVDKVSPEGARAFLQDSLGLSSQEAVDRAVAFYGGSAGLSDSESARNFGIVAEAATDAEDLCANRRLLARAVGAGIPAWGARLDSRLSFVPPGEGAAHYQDLALGFGRACFRQCGGSGVGQGLGMGRGQGQGQGQGFSLMEAGDSSSVGSSSGDSSSGDSSNGFSPPESGLGYAFRWALLNFARGGDPRTSASSGYDDDADDGAAGLHAEPEVDATVSVGSTPREGWVTSAMEAQKEQMGRWPVFSWAGGEDLGGSSRDRDGRRPAGPGAQAADGMLSMRSAGTHPAAYSDDPAACDAVWNG